MIPISHRVFMPFMYRQHGQFPPLTRAKSAIPARSVPWSIHTIENQDVPPGVRLAAEAEAAACSTLLRVLLEYLRDLHMDIKELGRTSVETDALALVQLRLPVIVGNAFQCTGLGEATSR